jgi:L-asparaginase II
VVVEVSRGDRVESFHRGAAVVVDARGIIIHTIGDTQRPIYPRSAVKPLQALPLVGSGAADRFGLSLAELAIASGSHAGTADHLSVVEGMLRKAGSTPAQLECGTHRPFDEASSRDLDARGMPATPLHNNCSGKHAGFLCVARALDADPTGYTEPAHPVMREVAAALAATTGASHDTANRATDGCSIPTFAIPLSAVATGFARLGTGADLPDSLARAAARIRAAVAAHPEMVAGAGRFDTRVNAAGGGAILCKCGAEGMGAAALPTLGLGIAVKIDDGASRAVEVVMATILGSLLRGTSDVDTVLDGLADQALQNWRGTVVGRVQATHHVGRTL